MALTLVSLLVVQPTGATATGGVVFIISGGTRPLRFTATGVTTGAETLIDQADGTTLYTKAGIPVGSYTGTVADSSTPPLTLPVAFEIVGLPTVDATPPELAAAHLPMPLVLRAAPTGTPLAPAALLAVVEVLHGSAWLEAGRLREVADASLGTAYFDLSEFIKTQFADTPPDESAEPDPALGVRYRVRYGRLPGFTGAAGEEAGTVSGLAVNASEAVNPGGEPFPLPIGPVTPYTSAPTGYARFRSRVNAAGTGIINLADVPALPAACPVRQFVWLTRRGAWSWGLFSGRHEHGTETADDTVVRRVSADYYAGGGDIRESLRVYSDKVDFATFLVLREVRRSRRVYERLASGLYVPVLVEKGSFPDYKETDKLFEVNFTVRYPVLTVQTF